MQIKQGILFITTLLLTISPIAILAQDYKSDKKLNKKELLKQKEEMMRVIDSLKTIIDGGAIELSDTSSFGDTLNVVEFNYADIEKFIGVEPGSNPDSLLRIWYKHRNINVEDLINTEFDSLILMSNIPDSVYINKITKMNSFIPIPYNNIVRNYIIRYTQMMPSFAKRVLGASSYYMPQFEEIFDYYGLPKELKAMAIIESALNPLAVSRTNAKGIWQFMYRTALQYNLQINSYVDERLDPIASAHAAAKYLRDSYTIFGDWALAISSYNCGSGNVNKAIRRAGSKEFWKIYPYLPKETRGYVPEFVAALYLSNYYKDYQIVPAAPIKMPDHIDTFLIKKNLHFEQISENIGISVEQLRQLNPQYTQDIIPGNEREYILRLPYNFTIPFVDKEKEIYTYKDSIYFNPIVYNRFKENRVAANEVSARIHTVKRGETLGKIAVKYGVKLSDLQKWNRLNSKSVLGIGQKLKINKGGYVAQTSSSSAQKASSKETKSSGGYTWYTIKKGDTLLGISLKYPGVTLSELLKINGFTKKTKIYPGKKIKIQKN
ncbi:MAG: transglycosylase SLT domain-containing protein [Bacteroidales bacterium]